MQKKMLNKGIDLLKEVQHLIKKRNIIKLFCNESHSLWATQTNEEQNRCSVWKIATEEECKYLKREDLFWGTAKVNSPSFRSASFSRSASCLWMERCFSKIEEIQKVSILLKMHFYLSTILLLNPSFQAYYRKRLITPNRVLVFIL